MKIERIYTSTIFKADPSADIDKKSGNSIYVLREPSNSIKFEKNREIANKADSIDTNPIAALGYKLYRTFNLLAELGTKNQDNKSFSVQA